MVRRMYRRYGHPAGPTPPTSEAVRSWMDRVIDGELSANALFKDLRKKAVKK